MRISIPSLLATLVFVAACSDGSSSSNDGGGGSGGDTGTTTSEEGGGGSGGATGSTTASTSGTDTSSTTSSDTSTTSGTTTTAEETGCESAGSEPVLFSTNVQPIFSQSCGTATTCHLKAAASEGLSLKPGSSYAALVDVNAKQSCNGQKRVQPGSAAGSYLVNKITATDVCPTTKKMPPSSTLSAASKQTIIDWICQGALNN